MALDHGELNVPLTGKRARSLEADISRAVREESARRRAEHKAAIARRKAEREAEKQRPKLTREDVEGARLIRDKWGWYAVIRVNAKSVTYRSSVGELRMPFEQILEVK